MVLSRRMLIGSAILVLASVVLPWGMFQGDFPTGISMPSIVVPVLAGVMLLLALIPGPQRWQALVGLILAGVCAVAAVAALVGIVQMGASLNARLTWQGPTAAFAGIVGYLFGALLLLRASHQPTHQEEGTGE